MTEAEIKQAALEYADKHYSKSEFGYGVAETSYIAGAEANAQKWIPIKVALPECPRIVIVVNAGKVYSGFYFEGKWYHRTIEQPLNNVSHYCEFPSPPNTQP